jgi:hypothetical protein
MNDLKFAFGQLLKNPGFSGLAGLTPEPISRLLPSQNATNLRVMEAHLNDYITAAAADVFAWTIANPPANLVGARVFPGENQALFEFDAFPSSADIGGGHGPGQRQCQFIFQDGFIQRLRHNSQDRCWGACERTRGSPSLWF